MRHLDLIIISLAAILVPDAMAVNPVDMIPAPLQENLNADNLQKKAVEHFVQGNLTQEHIAQDMNAAKGQIQKEAVDQVTQGLNITSEQLEQKAKDELKNQVNQKVQQPGFESSLAIMSILGILLIFRRKI